MLHSRAAWQGKGQQICPLVLCPFWEWHGAEHGAGGPTCQQFQTNAGKAASYYGINLWLMYGNLDWDQEWCRFPLGDKGICCGACGCSHAPNADPIAREPLPFISPVVLWANHTRCWFLQYQFTRLTGLDEETHISWGIPGSLKAKILRKLTEVVILFFPSIQL